MEALFLKLLRMSLSASVLVLAVLVLRLVLRRAPKWTHVLLWALVALRLLCPFTVESSLSLQPQRTDELAQSIAGYAEFDARSAVGQDGAVPEAPLDSNALHTVTVPEYDRPQSQSAVPTAWTTYFSHAWLFGVGAMLLYALVSYVRLRRRVAASLPLEGSVFVCDGIDSPFILGVFRPRVYVPSGLAEPQLSHVLSHERAHLARRDHWWKPLGFLLLSVYWFNPVLWLAYVLLCRDIELACDERVYRDMALPARADYSQTLLDCSRPRSLVAACPLAFGEVGTKDRVRAAL
ncbi:MAG: M56 family metallopeptidase, partial [Oscillospiraceae bacterium]|nr:M56 family metallopeptidase [Oscillospiraceae bacterium]